MNKAEFIAAVSEKTQITKADVKRIMDAGQEVITETLANKEPVTFVGFGTFKTAERAARKCINPATGESMKTKAKTVAKFKAGKALTEAVNAKKKKKSKKA